MSSSTEKDGGAKCSKSCNAEDELGAKYDRCVADTLLKTAGGFAIGVVTSFALLKGRVAPIWLGTGIGIAFDF
jgi:inner membrane organizing system protein 1